MGEGSLQAYLDGEMGGPAAAGVRDHVASCVVCAAELDALRHASERAHAAIGLLEAPVPMLRARAAIAAASREERASAPPRRHGVLRLGSWGLAKAAMLLLVLAGAGAAAIPDVRRALESTLARVAELFSGDAPEVATPAPPAPDAAALPAREPRRALVQPVDGSVRILIAEPASDMEFVIRLIDGNRADVQTNTTEPVRFVSSTGRLEVAGVTGGEITVGIPRHLAGASVDVGRAARIVKDGSVLVLSGPAGAQRGTEVRFTIRP